MKQYLPECTLFRKAAGFLVVLCLLLCLPRISYSSQSIYTVQTGSFSRSADALKQFDSLVHSLNKSALDHLRVEKIGKFHSVRLGRFESKDEADQYLRSVQDQLTTFLVMKAYYKEERIERLYAVETSEIHQVADKQFTPRRPISTQSPVQVNVTDKIIHKIESMGMKKLIETISDLMEKEKYKEALAMTKASITLGSDVSEIIGLHGKILFKLEQPAEAIIYLKKAAELSPGVSEYHNKIGYCLILLNKFDEAINAFKKAMTINPSHIGALAGLGISYAELGDKEKAMIVYEKLKHLDSVITEMLVQIIEGK